MQEESVQVITNFHDLPKIFIKTNLTKYLYLLLKIEITKSFFLNYLEIFNIYELK